MKKYYLTLTALSLIYSSSLYAAAIPCTFDQTKTCTLQRDVLNDKSPTGLKYYGATNYDHRISGEINVYNSNLVQSYTDNVNAPGQIKFILNKINSGFYQSGEIMTRANLNQPPFSSPTPSTPWTTKEIAHGYLEVIVKMPKCNVSSDGTCQTNTNPPAYNAGLWPAIWMMPTNDSNWPMNGEIDIAEAYVQNSNQSFTTATLHFNGTSPACSGGDCRGAGFHLGNGNSTTPLYNAFHSWGFEWQPDPSSTDGGQLITGYFDHVKIWGPLATDSLPADGKNALSRGFNDPNGGYYLIVNSAIGGPYAGAPNAQLQSANMYVQSVKAYSVTTTTATCAPPINAQFMVSPDKKQLTIAWEAPTGTSPIQYYEVHDWLNRLMWQGTTPNQRAFQDQTLPGSSGNFVYFLYTVCNSGISQGLQFTANVNLAKKK